MNSKMGFISRLIRNRIMSIALATFATAAVLPAALLAQEKLQPGGGTAPALGVGNEPVLVVTMGSMNKLMKDVNYLTSTMGQAQAGGMFQMMAATFTQGIDPTQPLAVLVPMVDGTPEPIAMLPTPDVNTVLDRLKAQIGPVDKLDDGTLAIAVGVNTIYIRQNPGWAVLARNRDLLAMAPIDPTQLFKGMGNDYDIAFRVRMQKVPAETRDMIVAQLRQGFEQAMAQQNNDDAEAARKMAENSIAQLELLIQDTDELSFGYNIDAEGKRLVIDFSFTAVAGSDLAEMYSGQKAIPSRFSYVIRRTAAAYFHQASSISPKSIEMAKSSLENGLNTIRTALAGENNLSPSDQADIAEMVDRIGELVLNSVSEGKVDMGAMLVADQDQIRFVLGGFVSDGNEAAQIVKELAEKVKDEPDAPRFKFDQSKYNGVTMHVIEADVPADEDEVRKIFGETLRVHIGTADKAVYLAVGDDSEAEMKRLIDAGNQDSGAERPLAQLQFALLPILEYAQSVQENDVVAAMINSLASAADRGEVRVVSDSKPNGATSQIVVGEGLLKAIGASRRRVAASCTRPVLMNRMSQNRRAQ